MGSCFSDEDCYRKSVNAFEISGCSVSFIVRKASKATVEHLGPELLKLQETIPEEEKSDIILYCLKTFIF